MNINARHYVVFGATGNTGQELVPLLLKAGHSVRAFVRSPAKVRFTHQRLEVIKGDITDTMDVRNAIKGTDGVISLVGGPLHDKSYQGGLLLPFIKAVHRGMQEHKVKQLLLQSGAAAIAKDEGFNFFKNIIIGKIVSRLNGEHGVHIDNNLALKYLENEADDVDWIVTRPPVLVDQPNTGKEVIALEKLPWPPVSSFRDQAIYSLAALSNNELIKTSKYCGYPLASKIHPPSIAGYVLFGLTLIMCGLLYLGLG
jgi:putative NADH-flavin reductase